MVVGLLFWLAVVGFIIDWRCIRRGGVRPTREERIGLGNPVTVTVFTIIVLLAMGANAPGAGNMAAW